MLNEEDKNAELTGRIIPINIEEQMNALKAEVNKSMPSYSKISKVEVMDAPFEKTPKMSIKRFMYK